MISPPMFWDMDAGCADIFEMHITDGIILVVPAAMQGISFPAGRAAPNRVICAL
jgi:hypothetical protein